MKGAKLGFIYDDSIRMQVNQLGNNYWYVYICEIATQLGFKVEEIPPAIVEDSDTVEGYSVIFVGGGVDELLSSAAIERLSKWVRDGGILIGFSPDRLDSTFGIKEGGYIRQVPNDYAVSRHFRILGSGVGQDVHSILYPEQDLVILSDIRIPSPVEANVVAFLICQDQRFDIDNAKAAITERSLGEGKAYYFSFDVPKTMWLLHQGRPVLEDIDGDGSLRTQDMTLVGGHCHGVMYADEIAFLIQNMIASSPNPCPFVHSIPPLNGKVADSFFYWAGDDEGSVEVQVKASNFMHSVGLPYQINCMPINGAFPLSDKDIRRIRENGHLLCLHYDFAEGYDPASAFSREDINEQQELFKHRFGEISLTAVYHCSRWCGWTEPARWMSEGGQIGDNSFVNAAYPPANPKNILGFAFGTAFPFYFYEDYSQGNRRLDFIELPHNAYEIGRTADESTVDIETTQQAVDTALRYNIPLCVFLHPVYLATSRNARRAVENMLEYIEQKSILVKHMTTTDAAIWWKNREHSSIRDFVCGGGKIEFSVQTTYPDGIVVKFPIDGLRVVRVECEGQPLYYEIKEVMGVTWTFIVVPHGVHRVIALCE